jgi:tetratricopeptide (TPR) repeat protein
MQVFTAKLAQSEFTKQAEPIAIGEYRFRADLSGEMAAIHEEGPDGSKTYPIAHAMGGKNVYYLLTPLERGRLQVLPLAYDVRKKAWLDSTGSMIRHIADEAVHWTDPLLTFNTSCHSCHVSQLSTNYDAETDTYHTTWAEPGINCETCHGPGAEHVRVAREAAKKGEELKDVKILSYKDLSVAQTNATCAPCHAKARRLGASFQPGNRFFDHYDLTAFEHADFYPDGRDLGENYTLTSWLMSPCVKDGKLSCMHCHTSSGRYRFAKENPNGACLPCHRERVENAEVHHRHPVGKPGARCVECHMPKTFFARMARSDHSMRPPTPAATLAFKSPNACNGCHTDKDAKWADGLVRQWHKEDYQAPVLKLARLVDDARKRQWNRLDEMLAYIRDPDHDAMFAVSLVRLLAACPDVRKWPALLAAARDPSPLVRAAAVGALAACPRTDARDALLAATGDDYRLVRLRAASELAGLPRGSLTAEERQRLERATQELLNSLRCRADDWTNHYNLGNFHQAQGRLREALRAFARASELRPDTVMPLVNASMAHAQLGEASSAEIKLRKALKIDPRNAAANFNFGLLMAERRATKAAERALRTAFEVDPTLAQAAYNLAAIVGSNRAEEAVAWCRKAHELRPDDARYAYTLGFYLAQARKLDDAVGMLEETIRTHPDYADPYALLGKIYESQGKREGAVSVYRRALERKGIGGRDRQRFQARLHALSGR